MPAIDAWQVLSDSFIAVTQDITQGLDATQIVSVRCAGKAQADACLECVQVMRKLNPDVPPNCSHICDCRLKGINLNQIVRLQYDAIAKRTSFQEFESTFYSTLALSAQRADVRLTEAALSANCNTPTCQQFQAQLRTVYAQLGSESMQSILNAVSLVQTVQLRGPGLIAGVNMEQMADVIMRTLQSQDNLQAVMQKVQNYINMSTSVVALASTQILIVWIVMIVTVLVIGSVVAWIIITIIQISQFLLLER